MNDETKPTNRVAPAIVHPTAAASTAQVPAVAAVVPVAVPVAVPAVAPVAAPAPEQMPHAGGSYRRNADGSLIKVEGPDVDPEKAAPAHATHEQAMARARTEADASTPTAKE